MDFMPHGMCLLWRWDLMAMMVAGDLLTATAYVIGFPWVFNMRRPDRVEFGNPIVGFLLVAFVVFCGLGHVFDTVNLWQDSYYAEAVWTLLTGIISWSFVFGLHRYRPAHG